MEFYNRIFLTNISAFYKNQLYSKIAEHFRILVLYTGDKAWERNSDFFLGQMNFEYIYLEGNNWQKALCAIKIIRNLKYGELVIDGWDSLAAWFCAMFFPKRGNACVIESCIFESKTTGCIGKIKKRFVARMSKAYVCGIPHAQLMRSLKFKGAYVYTGGCGLLNYIKQPRFESRNTVLNFLFVGRLVDVKNIELLIYTFNKLPFLKLNIIGFGPLEQKLKGIANGNITFLGPIENTKLTSYYKQNDVFILPSKSETWGLVIEEALNNGIPVIVSDCVGCSQDLVSDRHGIIFNLNEEDGLHQAILKMQNISVYNNFRKNISELNFFERAEEQINVYL